MISTIISEQKKNIFYDTVMSPIKTYITMTTIPERLNNKWFLSNIQITISLLDLNDKLRLHIPSKSAKNNQQYIVPKSLKKLESTHFEICNVKKDEGPITKLLPALRDKRISEDDIIIVCDDDIAYRENTFRLLKRSIYKNPNKISCMCHDKIEGFKSFAFFKKVLKGLENIKIPKSCVRIDDDIIQQFARHKNIETVYVSYGSDSSCFCSMNRKETDTHPQWNKLENDNREMMRNDCFNDLNFK